MKPIDDSLLAVAAHELAPGAVLLDVRRSAAYAASDTLIAGASWHDPEAVDAWGPAWAGRDVVVYCVHGHEVGRNTAARLRELGARARYLVDGFEGWKASGRPLQRKEDAS